MLSLVMLLLVTLDEVPGDAIFESAPAVVIV